MYFNKNIIFSILFRPNEAFDVLEFKTKLPGSYWLAGIHATKRTNRSDAEGPGRQGGP